MIKKTKNIYQQGGPKAFVLFTPIKGLEQFASTRSFDHQISPEILEKLRGTWICNFIVNRKHITGNSDGALEAQLAIEQIMSNADEGGTQEDLLGIKSFRELTEQNICPPQPLITGLLHREEKLMITAASKGKKSWTLMNMAVCVASGKPFLGMETVKSKVLYVDYELQEFWHRKRIQSIFDALLPPIIGPVARHLRDPNEVNEAKRNLNVLLRRGKSNNFPELVTGLCQEIGDQGYGLIIIDPFYKASSGIDELSTTEVGAFLNEMERLASGTGAAVAYSHHHTKGSSANKAVIDLGSGTGVFARDPDVIMGIRPLETTEDGTECGRLDFILRNLPPKDPLGLKWIHPRWVREETVNVERIAGSGRQYTVDQILSCLPSNEASAKDWYALCEGIGLSERTFNELKKQAIEQGKVIARREGKFTFHAKVGEQ